LKIYIDTYFASSFIDKKSIMGYHLFLEESLVIGETKRNKIKYLIVQNFNFEAFLKLCEKRLYIKIILEDLKILVDLSMQLYFDNKLVMSITYKLAPHGKIKY